MPEIEARLRLRRAAVFLDYDGTLTPIVNRPDQAWMDGEMRARVARLARLCSVAVVSGRDLPDVQARVGLDVYYAGNHGFDLAGPGGLQYVHAAAAASQSELDAAERELRDALACIAGACVERKRYSIAVHYRQVRKQQVAAVERAVNGARGRNARLRRARGNEVIELLPNLRWNEGAAVHWLMRTLDLDRAETLPICVGDDLTNDGVFRALVARGLGIVVRERPRPTLARYRLRNPVEVRVFLSTLADLLARA